MRTIFLRNLALIAFLLIGNLAYSQGGFVFKVLANKGANQVKRATGTTEGLKTGATLKTGDQIIAANGAYIGLMHKTGKTLEIKESGVIKVNDLEKKVAALKTSVTSRYAQYVMNKINEEEGGVRKNYRSSMNATGATTRGNEGNIALVLPIVDEKKFDVYNAEVFLRWLKPAETSEEVTYVVTVKNIFNEVLYSTETDQTMVKLNLDDEAMTNESNLYIVKVELKSNSEISSEEYAIQRVQLDEAPEVKSELETLLAEVDQATPMGKVIMATFYDENNLVLDAMVSYEKLVKENPEVVDFKDLYKEFLAKNKMVTGEEETEK